MHARDTLQYIDVLCVQDSQITNVHNVPNTESRVYLNAFNIRYVHPLQSYEVRQYVQHTHMNVMFMCLMMIYKQISDYQVNNLINYWSENTFLGHYVCIRVVLID